MHNALYERATPMAGGYRDIEPAAVASMLPNIRLIDVREPSEYNGDLGHIEGAELVPLAKLTEAARGWDRHGELVLICRSGGRSARAAAMLAQMGFVRPLNMAGGMLAWNAAGLPVAP